MSKQREAMTPRTTDHTTIRQYAEIWILGTKLGARTISKRMRRTKMAALISIWRPEIVRDFRDMRNGAQR